MVVIWLLITLRMLVWLGFLLDFVELVQILLVIIVDIDLATDIIFISLLHLHEFVCAIVAVIWVVSYFFIRVVIIIFVLLRG